MGKRKQSESQEIYEVIIMEGKGKVTNIQFTKASDLVGTKPATNVVFPIKGE